MAYAAIASLAHTISLIPNYHQESIPFRLKIRIASVHEHIILLQSFLEDSPDEANSWEERIREVTNTAEDIIELLLSDSLLQWTVGSSKFKFKTGMHELRYDFDELGRVIEEMESIAKGVKERHTEAVGGFNDGLMELISRLVEGPYRRETIPIVGVGGIGKTTLARNAYSHPLIVEHFDIRAWVTVSKNYSWERAISGLLSSMNILSDEFMLYSGWVSDFLRGRRYLIVLDDVWSQEAWDMLKSIFPYNWNGSRIILTTRCMDVVSRGYIHEMRFMNVDQSWNLLRHKIFRQDPCPPKLEWVGKMIARSCRGLPLAIEVVSGILAADQSEVSWEDIAENMETVINCEDNEHLLQIFHLSYTYLPHHLRPCFLYLGTFPEDCEIHAMKLVKLWVAEGFLNESGCKSFEETGEEYLEDLGRRSLVSVIKKRFKGRMKSFSVHDLIRDFCITQAQVDNFSLHLRRFLLPAQSLSFQRRVSIYDCDLDFLSSIYASTIRTFTCMEGSGGSGNQLWFGSFRLLRILDFSNARDFFNDHALPEEVFYLFHLRYLAFDFQFSIPEAVSNLQNLQTLIIRPRKYGGEFVKLPVEIWRLPQLRHLTGAFRVVSPSQGEETKFALENLQRLTEVADFICSRDTMRIMPNLKKLGIFYTVGRDVEDDYQIHNLIYLQKLEILKIETDNFIKEQDGISSAFPPTLKKLNLCGLQLPWEDMKIVGSLPNLEMLKLRRQACVGETWETNEGGFSRLKYLLIDGSDLGHWISESTHFPRLNCLMLHHCWRLKEVPSDFGEITTLDFIAVDRWNEFLVDWTIQIREDRQILGRDYVQIHYM